MGPRLRTRKNVRAPTIMITLIKSSTNENVVTGNVPNDGGTILLRAKLPAIANTRIIMKKRPRSIENPMLVLYQSVFAFNPPKAEPLFAVPDVKAYSTSVKPCGP